MVMVTDASASTLTPSIKLHVRVLSIAARPKHIQDLQLVRHLHTSTLPRLQCSKQLQG